MLIVKSISANLKLNALFSGSKYMPKISDCSKFFKILVGAGFAHISQNLDLQTTTYNA